jgi:hypothetical protein
MYAKNEGFNTIILYSFPPRKEKLTRGGGKSSHTPKPKIKIKIKQSLCPL